MSGRAERPRRQSVRFADHDHTIVPAADGAAAGGGGGGGGSSSNSTDQFALFDADDDEVDIRQSYNGPAHGAVGNGRAHAQAGRGKEGQQSTKGGGGITPAAAATTTTTTTTTDAAAENERPLRRPYGLKSTHSSREAEFDADDSDVDVDQLGPALSAAPTPQTPRRGRGADAATSMQSPTSPSRRFGEPLSSAFTRARRSISEASGGTDLRESLRHAIESEELPDWLRRGAGMLDSTWNMSNSILGAGVVGLPYSVRASGCLTGILLILGIALLTDWTIRLIVLNAKLSGRNTYIDIMDYCFGRNGRIAVSIFQGTFAFGGMCAFIVVIGDTIPHVLTWLVPALEGSFLASRALIMIVCTLSISFPLSLYRSIESLSRASAIALVSMVLIIVTIIVRGPAMPDDLKGDPSLRFTIIHPSNIVRSIAVISFAFVCHHNSLLIYGSLKEPSMDRFGKVTHYSTAIAATALVAMSLAGYWSFTDRTLGNVLNNFPADDTMVNIARFCFGMNMLTTWPLELFVAREVIETYYFAGVYDQQRHIVVTCALTLASLSVSLLATDLGVVLEVTGGLSATALAFICPSICYLKLCGQGGGSISAQNAASERGGGRGYDGLHGEDYEEEEEDDDDNDGDDRAADAALRREVRGDITANDVELPLRPGARLRRRGTPGLSGEATPWYLTTRPLAIGCTAFGCFVLVVSLFTTIHDAFVGSSVDVTPAPASAAAVAAGVANATSTAVPTAPTTTTATMAAAAAGNAAVDGVLRLARRAWWP